MSRIIVLMFALISVTFASDIFLEAENAILVGVSVSRSGAGFSGSGYVTGFDNDTDQLKFQFEAEAGLYELIIGYATPFGEKGYMLQVNGANSSGMFPAVTSTFSECKAGKYLLQAGQNIIIIGKGWGWFYIDYIKLVKAVIMQPQKPPKELTNKSSTSSTRSLFSYLVDNFGTKVLSGQQDMNEIEYIHSMTEKNPAIGVFDLIDYSPSRIEFGSNPQGSVESWINWAKSNNALVSLSWHWNAPTDLINEPGKEWYRGFYTDATTFDIEAVLADVNSTRYQLVLRDLDAIADQLKKFQKSDVPVLWRPLHEAAGRWFWWGAKGPEPFKKLWQLMYDRYTHYHKLNNLIWVYTSGDSNWYPGDDYVDVVSLDIYTDASSSMSGEWEAVLNEFNGRKLIALSESGTMPDPNKIRSYGVWWCWFSIWSGSFIHDVNINMLRRVYDDADIITLDELPDWRRYVSNGSESEGDKITVSVYPNPAKNAATVHIFLPAAKNITLKLFNILGQQVLESNYGSLSDGSHDLDLIYGSLAPGIFIIRLEAGSQVFTKKITLID